MVNPRWKLHRVEWTRLPHDLHMLTFRRNKGLRVLQSVETGNGYKIPGLT